MAKAWQPVAEMDLDNGEHTCYSRVDKKGEYIWLTQITDGTWNVEVKSKSDETDFCVLANSKTLAGAKQWAGRYINRIGG